MPTPNLALVPLAAAQSQKHITVNEALARLDAAAQLTALDRTRTAPPPSPSDGDRHIVAASATGTWAGHEGEIASWDAAAQGWLFLAPQQGWQVWIVAEQITLRHDGTGWSEAQQSRLGINATADNANRLTVAGDAVLLTHDGTDMRAKINKASDTDTSALLFQSAFTGHAEIGLTGGTDLHFKTSPNGITFTDALILDAASGQADFPEGSSSAGLSVSPDIGLNILPDQGRFAGDGVCDSHLAPSFVLPGYLRDFNGSTLTAHAQFIHNNATYGGSAGALDAEIDALLALTRDPLRRRYGVEWWAAKITAGSGTAAADTVDGTTRYPALRTLTAPMPKAYTVGFYLRVLSGSAHVNQALSGRFARWGVDETGNDSAGVVEPADGWVFIERQMTYNFFGYNSEAIEVCLESSGDEALLALPRVVVGHMALDPYLPGPMPNARFLG